MGGVISNGKDNDDLIDILIEADYLKTPSLQRIFRAVDRGDYYTAAQKDSAYRDAAWRCGNLHLSSPCVYSEVMEALKLKTGQSFLNLGSGSGYLSTLAGLILGTYGVNHGVEIYSDVVTFANGKLTDFLSESEALDTFEFCIPTFQVGNCLHIDSNVQLYDRVYCGASCPVEHEIYMKNLIKIGGILVMPLNNKLLRITRTSETTWESRNVLSVSFAPLLCPKDTASPSTYLKLPDFLPPSLQEACRSTIRNLLRHIIEAEHPSIMSKRKTVSRNRNKGQVRRLVIPLVDPEDSAIEDASSSNSRSNSDSDDNDADYVSRFTINSNLLSETTVFIQNFMQRRSDAQDEEAGPSRSRANENSDGAGSEPEKRSSKRSEDSDTDWNMWSDDDYPGDNSPAPRSVKRRRRNQRLSKVIVKRRRSCPKLRLQSRTATFVWKQVTDGPTNQSNPSDSADLPNPADPPSEEVESKSDDETNIKNTDEDNYKNLMLKKILSLPLPVPLRKYVNFGRKNI